MDIDLLGRLSNDHAALRAVVEDCMSVSVDDGITFDTSDITLREYGEERFAWRMAKAVVAARAENPIERTAQLADIIKAANPAWEQGKHPATRAFQAIRIFVNSELDELSRGLIEALDCLRPGGRLVVISFHSLEDRVVKRFFRQHARGQQLPRSVPVTEDAMQRRLKLLSKAVRPSSEEVAVNPRARSATLRIAEKIG